MKKLILFIYLTIQLFLYCSILFININIPNSIITYSVILLNMILGLYMLQISKEIDVIVTTFALLFTLISDTFLIFTDYKLPAMFTFSLVQIFYMLKIKNLKSTFNINYIDIIRITIILITITIMAFITHDLLVVITSFYFLMLVFNFIESIKLFKINWMIPVGFLLFIFCDIFVGLDFLDIDLNLNFNVIWFFYTPSQVLLTLSMFNNYLKKHN